MNMRRILTALSVAALCIGAFGTAFAQVEPRTTGQIWKKVDVVFRASKAAAVIGTTDSVWHYNGGLADLDTSLAINVADQVFPFGPTGYTDSLQVIRVSVQGTQAFASGESVYVTFDGRTSDGSWSDLGLATCGTCAPGGYGAAGALVPGTGIGDSKIFIGAGSATAVGVAVGALGAASAPGPGRAGKVIYGNFGSFPEIRIRTHSDYAVVPVSNLIKISLWYLSTDPTPAGR